MDPLTILSITALVMSIVLHEVAHGYAANWLGDPTARLAGRLTLNPISHIDLIGSILVPAFLFLSGAGVLFGWAKPVPYNPYNLKNKRWGEAIVAIAGPITNIVIALVFTVILSVAATAQNLPLLASIIYMNIALALFNMIPFPPLDGSKVLSALLPYHLESRYRDFAMVVERNGIVALFAFIFIFSYVLAAPFSALVRSVFTLFTGYQL